VPVNNLMVENQVLAVHEAWGLMITRVIYVIVYVRACGQYGYRVHFTDRLLPVRIRTTIVEANDWF